MFEQTNIARRASVAELIAIYRSSIEKMEQGYALLRQSQTDLEAAFFPRYNDFQTYEGIADVQAIKRKLKGCAWVALIEQLGIKKLLTPSHAEELERRLKDPDRMPEITLENVFDLFDTLAANANEFAHELITEVYNQLKPDRNERAGWIDKKAARYKTNQKNASEHVGSKIILVEYVGIGYGKHPYQVYQQAEKKLLALDRVFHLLDGSPSLEGYRSPLIDAINTSDGTGETDYFKFKCHVNHNLHIEFKRADLLQEFNTIAGGANLPSGRFSPS